MPVLKLQKGSLKKIQFNFEACDFDCPCRNPECTYTLIDEDLVLGLQLMRDQLQCPLFISSAYRCSKYQQHLKEQGYETAVGISQHELGAAADVFTRKHSGEALAELAYKVGFKRCGIGGTFIHVDTKHSMDGTKGITEWSYASRKKA